MKWEDCFQEICKSLYKVEASCGDGTFKGTGFVVAKFEKPDKLAFLLATAQHVVKKFKDFENIHWKMEKYDIEGNRIAWATHKSNNELMGSSPIRCHTEFDIATISMPKVADSVNEPLRLTNPNLGVRPGAKVGWAGFPAFVEKHIDRVHPCYFEGVISTTVSMENGRLYYLVDGHGGSGISGGPLWCWDEETNNYIVIGICKGYFGPNSDDDKHQPGLVMFESINPMIHYLKTSNELIITIV